jgi:hypothetical protein
MRRFSLCLLVALACAGANAREVKMSSPDSGSCPEATSPKPGKARSAPVRDTAPAREPRTRPSLHSDSPGVPGKPGRWHSFLPGMFR